MILRLFICLILLTTVLCHPKEEKKDRVYDRELSDKEHYDKEQHNTQYDHEAFLGEESKTFDQLPPEESKRRLGLIVDKIDENKDGFVSLEELRDWIKYTQKRYIVQDVDRQWKHHNTEDKTSIPWEKYDQLVYGFLKTADPEQLEKEPEGISYQKMQRRDRRRWQVADRDGDDALTKEEFANFLHPEESDHMKDIVVQETIDEIDKDGDGKISLDEYIGDMYHGDSESAEPEWVESERQQFKLYRDKNDDGIMDEDEIKNWIMPQDFDHAEAEARHLMYEADSDMDQQLTKNEVLDKYDLFVGSQATDFGEALARHDEF